MKLEEFRIQNYKKIRDTDWIKCEDLLVFVGKNEAGKSALLRALSKLKPTDGEKYDGLREFPHGRYTDEFKKQDWAVATGRFSLTADEKTQLTKTCSILDKVKTVTVTRHYSDLTTVTYEPEPKLPMVSATEWSELLESIQNELEDSVAPDGQGDAWAPKKQTLTEYLNGVASAAKPAKKGPDLSKVQEVRQQFVAQMNEQWTKTIVKPWMEKIDPVANRLKAISDLNAAKLWVTDHMPYFLYFGRYEVLGSSIYLPELVQRLQASDKSPRSRIQQALFKHVGVDITQLAGLGHHQHGEGEKEAIRRQIEELTIKANSASLAMTKKFADWWLQRNHRFNYKFNGDYFQIWVSDDLDPTDVEFEGRSQGMQYFFSFYLLFLVEAEEAHRNCILLLDEPGLHLHPTAQEKLIEFLDKIATLNQTFYSTHSPFLIDGSRLERARAVYETPNGTEVSANVWPRDRDTLFPLQAALGYSLCQTLFLAKKQVLVEGSTDYMLLSALNIRLRADNKASLARDIVMLPMGGTTNLAPLASMLAGHSIELAFLLDSDPAADSAIKRLKKVIADVDNRIIKTSELLKGQTAEELEELIPEDYYLDAVVQSSLISKVAFNADEQKITSRVDRLKAYFSRNNLGEFEKWRPILAIVEDIHANDHKLPTELLDIASIIFERMNAILSPSMPSPTLPPSAPVRSPKKASTGAKP